MPKRFHVGTQSWGYDDWVTRAGGEYIFYPRGTKRGEMLGLYSRVFDTIEVDATLYGVPPASTIASWYDETTDGFIFSLKFPREITHDLALRGRSLDLSAEFIERAAGLREKLGIFLVQFPASFAADAVNIDLLHRFLDGLPQGFRFAVEFRSSDWFVEEIFDHLQKAGAALCLVEGKWVDRSLMLDSARRVYSPFRYVRLMGERDIPIFDRIRRPRDEELTLWKEFLTEVAADEVFLYADNYFEGFALSRLRCRITYFTRSQEPAVIHTFILSIIRF